MGMLGPKRGISHVRDGASCTLRGVVGVGVATSLGFIDCGAIQFGAAIATPRSIVEVCSCFRSLASY